MGLVVVYYLLICGILLYEIFVADGQGHSVLVVGQGRSVQCPYSEQRRSYFFLGKLRGVLVPLWSRSWSHRSDGSAKAFFDIVIRKEDESMSTSTEFICLILT